MILSIDQWLYNLLCCLVHRNHTILFVATVLVLGGYMCFCGGRFRKCVLVSF